MSSPKKLRGGSTSELTKLKLLWRDSLSEDAREYWRSLFVSQTTQAQIRAEIARKLKINLRYDNQLNAFRDWELEQRARDLEAERMQEDERRLLQEHGAEWTLDQIREEVLKRSYARTLATGDFKLGLSTAKVDMKAKEVSLEREKFEEMKRKAAQADEAKGVIQNKALSEEERAARMREIFGIS